MRFSFALKSQQKPPWRVVFFGTDEFSSRILKTLFENRVTKGSSSCVVKQLAIVHPYTKKMTPVQRYASFCGLNGFDWPLKTSIKRFDVGVLASFGHLVPGKVIDMFPYGIINVHPSLLPQWRGAAPLHHTILSGSTRTGVSVMALKPKRFDVGPVLLQKEVDIPPKSTSFSLRESLASEGGKMVIEVLSSLQDYVEKSLPQREEDICYAHKITQPLSFIDWEHHGRSDIDRQYRALHENMELRTVLEGKTVRLLGMVDVDETPTVELDQSSQPGLPVFSKKQNVVWIKCKDGWVGFKNVVIKKKMTAAGFYNGYLSKPLYNGVTFASVANSLFDDTYSSWIKNRKPS